MNLLGPSGLPVYIALVLAILGGYALYRRHRVTDLVTGEAGHFEPMVQTSGQVLPMMVEAQQYDLFDTDELPGTGSA